MQTKRLTITVEYLTDSDLRVALRKIAMRDYKLPTTAGEGPQCKFADNELNGDERLRYKINSKLEEL